jgi:Tol biopolymer transport system component
MERSSATGTTAAPVPLDRRRRAIILGASALAILAAGYWAGRRSGSPSDAGSTPSRLALFAPTLSGTGSAALARQLAITPAGDAIVYVGLDQTAVNTLFLQGLDAAEPTQLQGGNSVWAPEISRDGRWIIAGNLNQSIRLPLEGGTPRRLPVRIGSTNSAWSPDGSYWYTDANVTGVVRVGPDDSVTALDRQKTSGLRVQQVFHDGRTALVTRAPGGTVSGPVLLLDLKTAALTPLMDGPVIEVRYAAGEMLAVLPDGSLTAAPFDEGHRRITGPATQIATGVSLTGTGIAQIAVADNGTVAYIPESPRSLVFMDRTGASRQAIEERLNLHAPHFSPDGRRLSLDITSTDGRDVWILSLDQGTLTRATFDKDGHDATWTPDGKFITYTHFNGGVFGVYKTRPSGGTPPESLLASTHLQYSGNWLRDMSGLVTTASDLRRESNVDVAIVRNGGHGPIEPLVATQFQEQYPALSPDDRWLTFVSDQSGRQEVYARPLNGDGDQIQISLEGGTEPVWGPDGREIFYRSTKAGNVELMDATVRTTPTFEVTGRHALFSVNETVGTAPHANYDISPDGRTFAFVRRSPATRIMVIQHLPELAQRLRGERGRAP